MNEQQLQDMVKAAVKTLLASEEFEDAVKAIVWKVLDDARKDASGFND